MPEGMKERGGGRIIIVSSRAAERGTPNMSGYAVAKASQVRLTEVLAAEGAEFGVKAFITTCPNRKSNPLAVDLESGDAAARCLICAN